MWPETPRGDLIAQAKEQQQRFRDTADKIRSRADLTAKTVGAVGTTVLTAVGIAKVGDLFPAKWADAGWWLGSLLVVVGFGATAFTLGFFTYRLWRINEPIFLASDVKKMPDVTKDDEVKRVERIYQEMADLNQVPSLRAYEARAHRYARIAERESDPGKAALLQDRARLISAEVLATETRALAILVRQRASKAIAGWSAIAAYAAFVVGAFLFAAGTDWLDSKHVDRVAIAKSCGEAAAAGATVLPGECSRYVAAVSASGAAVGVQVPPAGEAAIQRSQALTEGLQAAASLASTLKPALEAGQLTASAGREILQSFLQDVGFPLTKKGIEAVASTLWHRYVDPGKETVDNLKLESTSNAIKVVVIVRNQRPVVRVIRVPVDP